MQWQRFGEWWIYLVNVHFKGIVQQKLSWDEIGTIDQMFMSKQYQMWDVTWHICHVSNAKCDIWNFKNRVASVVRYTPLPLSTWYSWDEIGTIGQMLMSKQYQMWDATWHIYHVSNAKWKYK
jgi:hypothetical protein